MNKEHLITIKHFRETHKVSSTYVYDLIHKGKLAGVKIDGVYFIDISKTPNLPLIVKKNYIRKPL